MTPVLYYSNGWLRTKRNGIDSHTRSDRGDHRFMQQRMTHAIGETADVLCDGEGPLPSRRRKYHNRRYFSHLVHQDWDCDPRLNTVPPANESHLSLRRRENECDRNALWNERNDQIPPVRSPFRFLGRDLEPAADHRFGQRLDLVNGTTRRKEDRMSRMKNSRGFDRMMAQYNRTYAAKLRENGPPGVFRHITKASMKRSRRRACRRNMYRRGGEQMEKWTEAIRSIIRDHPIDDCDFSPLEDYINIFRRETSNKFRDFLLNLGEIELRSCTDWDYRLGEYYNQYMGMGMTLHSAFCRALSIIITDYDVEDTSTKHLLEHAERLSGQFRMQMAAFWKMYSDPKNKEFTRGLVYGSNGEVVLSEC